ncbi:MAG: B12-binding domain-containing radical SAM protein, partial [Deltaproteobacteria bacterium]|nr:B12-binding domain-containing radical SAM protein [Deltaproteobacteria bacterium]
MARERSHNLSRRELLAAEVGRIQRDAPRRVALVYPSPYRAAMSSLGYQTLYRQLNQRADVVCDRAVLPDDVDAARAAGTQLSSLERDLPLSQYPVLAFSVAYELELGGVIDCLELAGIPVLAKDRGPHDPVVIAGGPLTFSNPAPMAPYFDAIVVGEGEERFEELVDLAWDTRLDGQRLAEAAARIDNIYVGSIHGEAVPPVAQVDDRNLPAQSQIITPHTELASMFLTEAVRGCSRGCTYCVMRRSTNGGMRVIDPELILGGIPDHARRVGLVGAGVTDHPRVWDIVRGVVDAGREVGISSLRADRLDDELVGLLAQGGYRTLTIAADGASERMRRVVERSTQEEHLLRSAELANKHKLHTVKIYMMVGHPDETDADIDELIQFTAELRKAHPRIAYGIAPFVAKRHTP